MAFPKVKKWYPKNVSKYIGDVNNITTRSSWEVRVLNHCDNNPRVVGYSSEEVIIPYRSPLDNRIHRYFVDMYVVIQDDEGNLNKYLVEIKPAAQRLPPKPPKKLTPRFIAEVKTYSVNQAKWAAATEYCKHHKMQFLIVDENHILLKTLNKTKDKFNNK